MGCPAEVLYLDCRSSDGDGNGDDCEQIVESVTLLDAIGCLRQGRAVDSLRFISCFIRAGSLQHSKGLLIGTYTRRREPATRSCVEGILQCKVG